MGWFSKGKPVRIANPVSGQLQVVACSPFPDAAGNATPPDVSHTCMFDETGSHARSPPKRSISLRKHAGAPTGFKNANA